jgi:lipoprotein-anchoring transpeptidase ErfK/SrfK
MGARRWAVPVIVAGAISLTGCSTGQLSVHAGTDTTTSVARISLDPAPSTTKPVAPSLPLTLAADAGRLTDVVVEGPNGQVPGVISADGTSWKAPAGQLDYAATYQVKASAVDRSGLPTSFTTSFATVKPSEFLTAGVFPSQDSVYGVGMPITVTVNHRLKTDTTRAAFEKTLDILVNGQPADGAWNWINSTTVMFRPKDFWPGNATITVGSNAKGVHITKGLWGQDDTKVTFRTGDSNISYVDMKTHQLRVTRNGKTIRVIPITTGKVGFVTRSGVKVIENKERTRLMDASTGGTNKTDPEYYRLTVQYAMRLTDSGEFLHAAPWSVGAQGHANVSHGCTGMSLSNAAWLYQQSRIGDVVIYTGSDRPMEGFNGIGMWNIPLGHWAQGSALQHA